MKWYHSYVTLNNYKISNRNPKNKKTHKSAKLKLEKIKINILVE